MKRYPQPADLVSTPFVVEADANTCEGCGVCVDRCQMDALELAEDKVTLDVTRCIGCGLCVSTCPTNSLTLARKPDSELQEVPENLVEATIKLGQSRGKLGPVSLGKMQLKSKFDRLKALL